MTLVVRASSGAFLSCRYRASLALQADGKIVAGGFNQVTRINIDYTPTQSMTVPDATLVRSLRAGN